MPDRYDEQAAIAGEAAGLRPEQWPGLAHILRTTAADEREACAKIADVRASEGEDGTWQAQEGLIIIVVCEALIEATMTPAVVYRSVKDDKVWVRPRAEFCDGRFVGR